MSGDNDSNDRSPGNCQRGDADVLRSVSKPCPLCREPIDVVEQPGTQRITCSACGLTCVVDASPPSAPSAIAEIIANVPIVESAETLVQWLERPPRPIQPYIDPDAEARASRERRQRRLAFTAESLAAVLLVVTIAWRFGYVKASHEAAERGSAQFSAAAAKEARLLTIKLQLERERHTAELKRQAAERQTRLVTAKYLAEQAIDAASVAPWRGVALATQAVKTTLNADSVLVPEAHQSLRDALARLDDVNRIDGIPLRGHRGPITALAASPDGRWLATGSSDNTVRVWDLFAAGGQNPSIVLNHHADRVTNVLFSADGCWLVTASLDSNVCLWDMRTMSPEVQPIVLPGRAQPVSNLALSANGRWLATICASDEQNSGLARLWDLGAGPHKATSLKLTGEGGRIHSVAISPDSRWLAVGVDDSVRMWDLNCRMPTMASLDRHCLNSAVNSVLFTPDGRWLVTDGKGGGEAVQVWHLTAEDPTTSTRLRGPVSPARVLTASPDSQWLVTVSKDDTIGLWNLHAATLNANQLTLATGVGQLTCAAISGDGKWLAVASHAGNVLLWEMTSTGPRKPAVVLRSGDGRLSSLAFTSDSRWLAAGGDQTARLWNLNVPELVTRAASIAKAHGELGTNGLSWLASYGSAWRRALASAPPLELAGSFCNASGRSIAEAYAEGQRVTQLLVASQQASRFAGQSPSTFAGAQHGVNSVAVSPALPPLAEATPLPPVNEPTATLIVSTPISRLAAAPGPSTSAAATPPALQEASILVSGRRAPGVPSLGPTTSTGADIPTQPAARTAAGTGSAVRR